MDSQLFFFVLRCFIVVFLLQDTVLGCQPQLCRRRRTVTDAGTVKINLTGCSGSSPIWTRQIAYCLNLRVTEMTLGIKEWYDKTYKECEIKGCQPYISTRDNDAVSDCVQCWTDAVDENDQMLEQFNVSKPYVTKCIEDYIEAYLDNELPTFKSESRFKSTVNLAKVRPAEHWWSVTVELPCKPKVFVYFNAYCINSFARALNEGEYVLVQNNLITQDDISFYVQFSDSCTFEPDEINIIWDESTPAPALPQVSSFPSKYPPEGEETVNIFYDLDAARRLLNVHGGGVEEFKTARTNSDEKQRIKRATNERTLRGIKKIGLQFPCEVRSFKAKYPQDRTMHYEIEDGTRDRFLVNVDRRSNRSFESISSFMNFTLDYGFLETGCYFDSGDISVVPDPPLNWIKRKSAPKTKRLTCVTCINQQSDKRCLETGRRQLCASGEVCQTEIREISRKKRLITKACKQKSACDANARGKKSPECRPGNSGSVCRCCCNSMMCNAGKNPCTL